MIVAIDGPAASGKGAIARRLAARYGLRHLDTGLIYRATALALLDAGASLHDVTRAVAAARGLDAQSFDEERLRGEKIGEAASIVAAMPEVRAALVDLQRRFAASPQGAVLDGRDIGTAICPHADVKLFVTASAQERARRRTLELRARGEAVNEADILADILRRDERDSARATAPLRAAADAVTLDTTMLDLEQAVAAAIDLVERARSTATP